MFGVEEEMETGTAGVSGENSKTDMGLVLSEEDTTEGVSRREVLEHQTDATEGVRGHYVVRIPSTYLACYYITLPIPPRHTGYLRVDLILS